LPKIFFIGLLAASFSPSWASSLEPASSAEFCGRCHRAILDSWKTSAHARSVDSPLFQAGLDVAKATFGAGTERTCLECHAPLAILTNDSAFHLKASWEGVTCDYCHSIREVSIAGPNPKAKVELSLVKSGPTRNAASPVHGTVYSPVHTSSSICAPCHQYSNPLGFTVLDTYSEWQRSRYAKEGKDCQSCHMYVVAGNVVDPKIMNSGLAKVNLHQMPGGHSLEQLTKTIKMQLTAAREGNQIKVVVQVANTAAGHYVPTGSPMRQLILDVTADPYGGKQVREQRIYHRTVAGKDGKELALEPQAFIAGAKTVSDNRLAPDEKRTETFTFSVPAGTPQTQVQATLSYYYSPLAETEAQKRMTFLTLRSLVK
jgi:Zn-finger protein